MNKCFQWVLSSILRMVFRCTLNLRAKSSLVLSRNFRDLRVSDISNTCEFVSFAYPLLSPFWYPFLSRPFTILSSLLFLWVPKNKCRGLQQGGLSHLWHTIISSGIGPLCMVKEIRCASHELNFPYPSSEVFHSQSQQSESDPTFTRNQKSQIISGVKMIDRVVKLVLYFDFVSITAALFATLRRGRQAGGAAFSI